MYICNMKSLDSLLGQMRSWPKCHLPRDIGTNDSKNILQLAMTPHLDNVYDITMDWYFISVHLGHVSWSWSSITDLAKHNDDPCSDR